MTALFEMRIRAGGDPRGFGEFMALRDELAKLSHPACPDVNWAKVEQLCLSLFQSNGADLQTAVSYALARSQRHGLPGMVQGLALIEALSCECPHLWPPVESMRLDSLSWLFAQLQPLLRSLALDTRSLSALVHLDTELSRLSQRLDAQAQAPMVTLQALRQQVDNLMRRLQQSSASDPTLHLSTRDPEPAFVMPIVILPPPPMPYARIADTMTKRHRMALWLFALATAIALASWLGWQRWLAGQDSDRSPAEPVQLDSLMLFDAGSAELNSGSTKMLINGLAGIKARPGWLIVIAGHSDATGDAGQNLALSRARASAVRDWMQRMGDLPDSCFAVQGLAASQPVTGNDTESGRAANRRVDIHLVPQEGACGS
ncbi:type VI secretion system protein VasL [Pseudomonas lini]|uniref:OmpA family protein n=1 Tax=Pseudomonas lini TaxID=163011 RepID=UPI002783DF53|nr:OmpA family protein [Pseudomonas lini]MDQ0123385.1 type VI secretion system protein VasL [Pseudomonas lini]